MSALVGPVSLRQVAADLRSGRVNLLEFLDRLCDRIEEVDAVVQSLLPEPGRRERLRREARALLRRYPDPQARPPLFGVPMGVKDIFRVDGFPTRCGSALPPKLFAGPEAPVVTALKRAGCLVLGKTVTTEFAYFQPGPTRNPWNPEHTPGGSSSGSAAAVAAGLAPLALGSQTVGSVIRPAAFCGVTGFKPTRGRCSVAGVIPYAPSLDHVGLFVAGAGDLPPAAHVVVDLYAELLPRKPALGIPTGPYLDQASPEALRGLHRQVERLEEAGYRIVPVPALPEIERIGELMLDLCAAEMAEVHRAWFARYEPLYAPRTAAWIRHGMTIPTERLEEAREERSRLRGELERAMDEAGIDLWICPSATGPAPAGLESTGDPAMNVPWTYAGMPAVSVPAGLSSEGLPLGLQCIGRFDEDEALIRDAAGIAHAVQP